MDKETFRRALETSTVDMAVGGVHFCPHCGSDMRVIHIQQLERDGRVYRRHISNINGRISVRTSCGVCRDGRRMP